jgi:4-hydroxyproline epimerase
MPQFIEVIDSHTAGEPTRVVVDGGPSLPDGPLTTRLAAFRATADHWRASIVNEPRGWDAMVGALLCEPDDPQSASGVIFFNNVGCLGMCVHGAIGVVKTLAHLGRIQAGTHRLDTPVGTISATLHNDGRVTIRNVPSYRSRHRVPLQVDGVGEISGDVAWGGNWFFLVQDHAESLVLANVERLTEVTWRIRQALAEQGIAGDDGHEIDHVELFGPPQSSAADSRNFVLCPGKAYDRSPCGTGTSAKIACLAADGLLAEGETWRQESILGSLFEGRYERSGPQIIPSITGAAFVTAETRLVLEPRDPFCHGIRA